MPPVRDASSESWLPTVARVTGCKVSWFRSGPFEEGLGTVYRVTYSYRVLDRTYRGSYVAGSPQTVGHTFEILYNPVSPRENTGSGDPGNGNPWIKLATAVVGVAAAALLIWLVESMGLDQ